jgi:hypothetical protein
MARRILNRKDLRADYEAAERRKGEDEEVDEEAEQDEESEDEEEGDEESAEATDEEADEHAARLTTDKKSTHFVQPVKEPMEEKKEA